MTRSSLCVCVQQLFGEEIAIVHRQITYSAVASSPSIKNSISGVFGFLKVPSSPARVNFADP